MKLIPSSFTIALLTASFASGAQPERNISPVRAAPAGMRFEDTGKIAFHRGQPCTSQIMFDFHGAKSPAAIWLAVNSHEERLLIDAARKHRRVRISGKWNHGKTRACAYVSVVTVQVERSKFLFWQL